MIKKVELDSGGKVLSLETGRMANQAGGSVVIRLGDTMVMATATTSKNRRPGIDFFPLLVDFEEKLYAIGRIPGGFFKREGRPTETAILTSRRIDRPIRPLFPKGFRNDVQLVITPLSVDQDNPPDILAINAASAALTISDAPFDGPIGAARIGRVDGEFIVDPTYDQIMTSDLDVVIAGTEDKISMIECGSDEVSEADVLEAIKLGQKKIKEVIELQKELLKKTGEKKSEFKLYEPDEKLSKYVKGKAGNKVEAAMGIEEKGKQMDEIDKIKEDLESGMDEELKKIASASPADLKNIINDLQKKAVRKAILEKNHRPDGRKLDEVREINCEVGIVPRAHGSALFSRGDTQVLTVATLGALGEEQRLEGLSPENSKRYMHHYNFPAFSVGEVRPIRGPGRREIGHGALAEKSLFPVVPNEEKFPYTIRLVSEVLSSNGSTSMASTCASTLALMDCGVKISNPVAGISVGLVTDGKKEVMFTDIQGIEDFFGDMDFKVSGTKQGITGIQVDCKVKGLSIGIIEKALKMAQVARMSILEKMLAAIGAPREELSQYAPSVVSIKINPEKIGAVIGPGGKMIRKITEETDAKIDIEDDGTVLITASDPEGGKRALKMIEDLTFEPKVGSVFKARVVKIMAFGAFVQIAPGKEGLVHISEIAPNRINRVEDVLNMGDEVIVKLTEVDDKGRNNFSIRAVTPEDKAKLKEE